MKRILLMALVMLVLTAVYPVPASAHNEPLRCGHRNELGVGWWKVRAHGGAGCRTARRVAEKWHDRVLNGKPVDQFRVNQRKWRCRDKQAGYESVKVRCRTGESKVVHFYWGS